MSLEVEIQLPKQGVPDWLQALKEDGRVDSVLAPRKMGMIERWRQQSAVTTLEKAVGRQALKWREEQIKAEEQGAVVNPAFHAMNLYDSAQGTKEKTGTTFNILRAWAHHCEPMYAIIARRIEQVTAYCEPVETGMGFVKQPGFRIRMTQRDAAPSRQSKAEMSELEQYIWGTGWCEPPRDEKPENYQRGLRTFLEQFVRDSLTLDWVAVRFWKSKDKVFGDKWPAVAFSCVDAARIRAIRRPTKALIDGVQKTEAWDGKRTNMEGEITHVRVNTETPGGLIEQEYTADEMKTYVRNLRTAEYAYGYGYPELEASINMINGWLNGRDYNLLRFRHDTLPRGILSILGNVDERQFQAFRLEWKQLMQGLAKRWVVPTLRGLGGQGAGVSWTELDGSSRDMEYHQMMFLMAACLHANYGIHPEETNYQALNPYRPPLSEASPEAKLKYSQDWGLRPLLKHIADFINREIVWYLYPDRRYTFEFVGLGDYLEAAQLEIWGQELNMGLNTPRNIWRQRDIPLPEPLADHPAWDLPMPMPQGMAYVDGLAQQAQAQQQAAMQQAMMGTAPPGMAGGQGGQPNGVPMMGGPAMMGGADQGASPLPQEMLSKAKTLHFKKRSVIVRRQRHREGQVWKS